MADNLTVTIGADSTKLRADLAKAQSALKEFSKELRSAADEARKTGQTEHLQAASARYEAASASVRRYAAELHALGREHLSAAMRVREMGTELGHFAHYAGLGVEGIRALRFGLVALVGAEVIRGFTTAMDKLNELRKTANEARVTPEVIASWHKLAAQIGDDVGVANTALKTFTKNFDDAKLKQLEMQQGGLVLSGKGGSEIDILTGKAKEAGRTITDLQSVIRGGQGSKVDWSDPFKAVGITDLRDKDKVLQDLAKQILAIKNAFEQNDATMRHFGQTFETMRPYLEGLSAGTMPKGDVGAEQMDALGKYNKAVGDASEAWDEVNQKIAVAGVQVADLATKTSLWAKVVRSAMGQDPFSEGNGGASAPLPPAEPSASADLPPANGQAAGGYIRGPGSSTSDSILARLSNGEFVMRARAVRALGVNYLHSLNNGFAMGGLVTMPRAIPALATGGLASATRAAVNFHLGSQVFTLTGHDHVVDSMVSAAHAQQVRSAGVKPSWFGSRAGGR